jgi:hypothetical protein
MSYCQAKDSYKGKHILFVERSRDYDDDMVGIFRYDNNFTIQNLYDTATGAHLEDGDDEKMNWARHINYTSTNSRDDRSGRQRLKYALKTPFKK